MSDLLRIGLSACFFHEDPQRPVFKNKVLLYFEEQLAQFVLSYGAVPLLLPRKAGSISARDILEQVDGVLFEGGSDLSPLSYDEEPARPEWEGDKKRDEYELELLQEAMAMDKPVLGVCRGLQLINVAMGGTLYQDIPTQVKGAVTHRNWEVYDKLSHEIRIEPNTRLAELYQGIQERKIVSIHHQAIKDIGEDLIPEAFSKEDGLIEAIRYQNQKNEKESPYVFWGPMAS